MVSAGKYTVWVGEYTLFLLQETVASVVSARECRVCAADYMYTLLPKEILIGLALARKYTFWPKTARFRRTRYILIYFWPEDKGFGRDNAHFYCRRWILVWFWLDHA